MPGLTLSQMGISTSGDTADDQTAESSTSSKAPTAGAAGGGGGGGGLKRGLSARTGGMRLPGSSPAGAFSASGSGDGARNNGPGSRRTAEGGGSPTSPAGGGVGASPFSNFRKIVYVPTPSLLSLWLGARDSRMAPAHTTGKKNRDPSGRLNFAQKAILHSDGVDFSSGASFKIKMDEFELFEELGKGNYGTVQKVVHKPTAVTMALKVGSIGPVVDRLGCVDKADALCTRSFDHQEIRLELDDSKLKTIITELDILHRATSPFIVDFYGAFFIESCVYYCMEFMDAGSLDFFAGCDLPEDVLARITRSMVEGLKFLKDELKIMHRDVKPTNVLLNLKGYVKLCDFGVSGQLDRSLAKTNIGCQSYMAVSRPHVC